MSDLGSRRRVEEASQVAVSSSGADLLTARDDCLADSRRGWRGKIAAKDASLWGPDAADRGRDPARLARLRRAVSRQLIQQIE